MAQTTKRAMEASLKRLLLVKPLNKITISDIAEDCGISRMTFYYHFKDIYDLVEWSCQEDAGRALQGNRTADTWQTGFLSILESVRANKPFIMNVYQCVSRERVERYLYEITYDLLIDVVREESVGLHVREDDQEFIAHLFKYAFVGIVLEWIADDMSEEPSALVDKLAQAIEGDFRGALERFAY
ncbi:TetR family transcriptional regulator [Bifidobacterium lemurum]|uniref:TetR family transcriptional regulator n=1 Tax=Bifidobacterium lemurum TaxID=1603886 RepID=A0A261FSS2_9BIFI|nr:TetR/AcrR family transcriptional regulator [Bifidobacterium lemurum]OZG62250.1 TetR family transcriptional regulator [Bifidobacterium lemurum]QOL33619.1 TetR/AcrR family transcriptional regulator [Bifidobacterium lemurum]